MDAVDPFGTADVRARVLAAWAASPARLREDANAEEDYALGAYRDRLVVELAQNAADAATRARERGRLALSLRASAAAPAGWELVAANTGAPLDAAGVESLSTLRASSKRDDDAATTTGRYGVGFAAVLDVTDEPALLSTAGGVSWSRAATRNEVSAEPALVAELEQRAGHVPALRLPWPADARPPEGFTSAVVLPLRDADAVARVRAALADVDAALLLVLPSLEEVSVDVGDGAGPLVWRAGELDVEVAEASGPVDVALLADRPTEERLRTRTWAVRWAFPRPSGTSAVLHAPTATDEPVDLPALLVASFPLEPGRRHVATGRLHDLLVERSAQVYVEHVRAVAGRGGSPDEVCGLLPGPVGAGPLDAQLRAAVVDRLGTTAFLPGGSTPDQALAVDGLPDAAVRVLADAFGGLLPAAWARRRELDRVGVRRMRLADLVDELAMLDRPVPWWGALYEALEQVDAGDLAGLAGLPVPLADGRLVRGPRGVVLDVPAGEAHALQALGLRVGAPGLPGRLLSRLGAASLEAASLLDDPSVQAAAEASFDAEDPGTVADAVLGLVRDARSEPGQREWLAALALPDEEGGWAPAGELLLPDGPLAALVQPGSLGTVDPSLVERWGADVLAAVGALDSFAVVRDEDVSLDPDGDGHDLDGEDAWADAVLGEVDGPRDLPPLVPELVAVRDLDLVAPDRWPRALAVIAADPVLRAAVVVPTRVLTGDGRALQVEPYTAWWLRTHEVLDGRRPDDLRAPGTAALAGLLDEAPDLGLDAAFLRAIGVVTSVAEVASSPMLLPLLAAGVDVAAEGLAPDGAGHPRPVPDAAREALGDAAGPLPATYLEHDDLTVAGTSCQWWVGVDLSVHAATVEGLARGLSWAAGRWDRRWLVAAALAEPERLAELLAESAWDVD